MESFFKALQIEKISPSGFLEGESVEDCVVAEERIAFYLNGQKLLSVMSIPREQDFHFVGFLISEGVISDITQIKSLEIAKDGKSVSMEASIHTENLQNLFREKTLTSGCCVGVAGNLEGHIVERFVESNIKLAPKELFRHLREFETPSSLFSKTGCVHKAMLVLGDTILISEDIGRHNAIDKVMGKACMQGLNAKECVLYVSGRLSLEMVIKAVMHNIPIVISKAAATLMGVRAAQETGVTLIGFARGEMANIYTHSGRIQV
ncbi:formate dehydrogenase accessory sulfurtransferase FdhD [Helicobacter winghamensis]|uniref:Sulfur carrier protein FdhD n=1 Tax=Helicobacter winghamensis TaxID=157268 RepID=A0A2N3PLD2_9HELI|nr:formate dehydrogenase accessory sulfurtransferase FdhD [Helicobacter winghamensis]EEO26700.1 formate dehydrogenase family accessory protein FdhD [Helicobacter winghamensis ATCC BAA-430]PKT79556.1 sufurtransferase FdhD [Helicobacter winghamensis]PKT79674.1 sufurtransferase FdhD [Helicobacter winghamensis]PKT79727.1 sufurtransferase FdhD [Helicobacter winghamensis]PKT82525.1 sufurtransferase FdhD [Helicobacter winghamensis]